MLRDNRMSEPRPLPHWKAIAAMAENRAIGIGNKIPWHLPEDFRWFKQCTLGNVVVMGRLTFESLGKPLPGRTNLVLTRRPADLARLHPQWFAPAPPGTTPNPNPPPPILVCSTLDDVRALSDAAKVFIAGGANVYQQALPLCAELLLTRVKRHVDGDAFFPPFEHLFDLLEIIRETDTFRIERWRRMDPPLHPA